MSNTSTSQTITTFLPLIAKPIIEYVFPVFGPIGLIGNLAIIVGMARVKREFSNSLRFYYIALAVAEFVEVNYYLDGVFYELGIWYLTDGKWKTKFLDLSDWSCKILISLFIGSDTVGGFTVVCLGVERVIAVTWPLRAKGILTFRFSIIFETIVCTIFLIIEEPLILMVYDLEYDYTQFYWAPLCNYNFSLAVTTIYMLIEEAVPLIFTVLSFVITVYLSIKIVLTKYAHHKLTQGFNSSGAESAGAKLSARELSNVLTLIVLNVMHLLIYLPTGFLYVLYTVLSQTSADESLTIAVLNVGALCNELIIIPRSINVFVYLFRSRAFRIALFGDRCACSGTLRGLQQVSSVVSKRR